MTPLVSDRHAKAGGRGLPCTVTLHSPEREFNREVRHGTTSSECEWFLRHTPALSGQGRVCAHTDQRAAAVPMCSALRS